MKIKTTYSCFSPKKHYLKIIMRLLIFLCFFSVFSLSPEKLISQNTKIIIHEDKTVTMDEVFKIISDQTDYKFFYHENLFANYPKVQLKKGGIKASKLLKQSLSGNSNVVFELLRDKTIIIKGKPKPVVSSNVKNTVQGITVTGKVIDESGIPLAGANIIEKGTSNGVQADFDGNYSLTTKVANPVIVISYVGYKTQEISVLNKTEINITLEEDAAQLGEVIVVGYGKTSEKKLTASVAQVSGEQLKIEERPVTSIQGALIGSVPGARGFNANGRPGTTPGFAIRGVSSLNNTSVLVIVDGFEGSLTDIDPQDVETVTLLKDASAVSIYGVRGANGVLLVTTKDTNKNERLSVSYNTSVALQTPHELPRVLASRELVEFSNFAAPGTYGQTVIDLANSGFYPDTQWQEELYKSSAPQYIHNLSVNGGSERVGYLLNASSLNQEGLVLGSDNFKRRNLRIKVDADLNDWLAVGTNAVITNRITTITPAIGGNGLLGDPFFPVRRIDGLWVDKGSPGQPNPIAQAASGSFERTVRDAINLQLYAKVSPLKGLSIEERVSIIRTNTNTRDWRDVYDFIRLDETDPSSYTAEPSPTNFTEGSAAARRLNLFAGSAWSLKTLTQLNYEFDIADHSFDLLLGFQSEEGESENFRAQRINFPLGSTIIDLESGLSNSNLNDGLGNASSRGGNARYLSYFGRLNYDFREGLYNLSFSFRFDGSSNFLDDRQYQFFPAVGGAWNIGDESFFNNVGFVDKLKLRASIGLSGDDSGVGRAVTQLINFDVSGYPIGGEIAPRVFLGQPASRNLQWETSEIFNVGLDFSLWQGKLQVKSDYFINNRKDILARVLGPIEFGLGDVPANLYDVKSWGWELDVTHKNRIGNVDYFISANITDYDNEITDLDGLEQPDFAVGQSVNQRFGYETDGFFDNQEEVDANFSSDGVTLIDQSNVTPGGSQIGRLKYVDQLTIDTDDDGIPDAADGVINADDRKVLTKNSATNLNIGISLGASYKGFSLSARLYGALDRDQWWNGSDAHEPFLNGTNAFSHQLNYWRPDNNNAFFPAPEGVGIQEYNSDVSHFIRDNEFIKLQNVTLAYDLSKKTLERLNFIKGLKLALSVENVGTVWTNSPVRKYGWDPELGVGAVDYPLPVTTSLSVNVKF